MSDAPPSPEPVADALEVALAAILRDLGPDQRRRLLGALGLEAVAPWGERMVYVETRRI